jgi:hypothetical protein
MKIFSKYLFLTLLIVAGTQFGLLTAHAAGKVSPNPDSVIMDEDGDEQVVEVRLDEPIIIPEEGELLTTINISSDDDRVEVSPASVTYLPAEWAQIREFTITTVGDEILNPDNEVTVTLSVVSDSEYYSGYENTVSVTLIDDEADVTPPDTFILSIDTDSSMATFEFSANEEATFECSLDAAPFTACTSPYVTPVLVAGPHTFEVRAIDASLNEDATPASHEWKFIEPIDIWHLDATSGDFAIDSWQSDNDGTVTGTPNWTTGRAGNALSFDGSTNYITIDRPVEDDFTICAWIKTDKPGVDFPDHWRLAPIIESEVGGIGDDFGFGVDVNGYLAYGNGGEFDATVNGSTSVIDNEWHHTCVTRNTTTGDAILYVDGVEDATGVTDTATLDANENAYIGNGTDGATYFDGLIDEIFVYDFVLSSDDIETLYEETLPIVTSVSPVDGGENIGTDALLVVTFAEAMATESLVVSTSPCTDGDECATYDVFWSEGNTVLTLIKSNGLFDSGITYTISLSVQDETGNEMEEDYEWSFATVRPRIVSGSYPLRIISRPVSLPVLTQTPKFTFTKDLKFGMTDSDVLELQKFLNNNGFPVSIIGNGAKGSETTFFGFKTKIALSNFQKAHNISPAVGYFGKITRGMINTLLQQSQ